MDTKKSGFKTGVPAFLLRRIDAEIMIGTWSVHRKAEAWKK